MSSLLKDRYSKEFFDKFLLVISNSSFPISQKDFFDRLWTASWEDSSLKERMRHVTQVLQIFLPNDPLKGLAIIQEYTYLLKQVHSTEYSLEYLFLADYISEVGIHHFDAAMETMEVVTTFTSCEFAVRPFFKQYPSEMLQQMQRWSKHENIHLRRLASEGSRPKLPWGEALTAFVGDPTPLIPILENLKNDSSEYVRRSVANNINDISKTHPDLVLNLASKWSGGSSQTNQLLKHALRTLLKNGNTIALKLIGIEANHSVQITNFKIHNHVVELGGKLNFSFGVLNASESLLVVRLEYRMYFKRLNKEMGTKVFQISQKEILPSQEVQFSRSYSFNAITTRKYYPGLHAIELIVNGIACNYTSFELLD
jgi:3-methyladenine DNA glycosylase AlkC